LLGAVRQANQWDNPKGVFVVKILAVQGKQVNNARQSCKDALQGTKKVKSHPKEHTNILFRGLDLSLMHIDFSCQPGQAAKRGEN
jgi:hypothetical protein